MSRARFSRADLIAEFLRVRGSGRAEDQVDIPAIRRQLARSLRAFRRTQRTPPRRRIFPAVDLKKLQANDLD
ncbi:branched-chain amino acid ABC transporter substrate-binding protein [Ralstonia solanacearum]|nr:branched-chain amino acid ABC transporter substrate-binding protein [Ralstonia solanacearum]